MENIKQIDDWLDSAQLIRTEADGKTKYNFKNFTFPLKFTSKIYRRDVTLQEAKDDQQELKILINKLNKRLQSKKSNKNKRKRRCLKVCKKIVFYEGRDY